MLLPVLTCEVLSVRWPLLLDVLVPRSEPLLLELRPILSVLGDLVEVFPFRFGLLLVLPDEVEIPVVFLRVLDEVILGVCVP